MAFQVNIISETQLEVTISDDCAPLVRDPETGEEERDWGNADWPTDAEIAEQATAAYGRPVLIKFADAIRGDAALYEVVPGVRRVVARKRDLSCRGKGTEEFLLAQDGGVLVWATQHSRGIITKDDWCARGVRASERHCSTRVELPVGTLVVCIMRDVGGGSNNSRCLAGIVSANPAHRDGVDWEEAVKHVGRRKDRDAWIHVLTIDGKRQEIRSS